MLAEYAHRQVTPGTDFRLEHLHPTHCFRTTLRDGWWAKPNANEVVDPYTKDGLNGRPVSWWTCRSTSTISRKKLDASQRGTSDGRTIGLMNLEEDRAMWP